VRRLEMITNNPIFLSLRALFPVVFIGAIAFAHAAFAASGAPGAC
jgi:hypothetical protein